MLALKLLPVRPPLPLVTLLPELLCERFAPPFSVTEGNRDARCSRTSARACAYAPTAAATFWFDTSTRAASWSSTGSPNNDHHGPRAKASAGAAGTQPSASLKVLMSGVDGRW